jgi:cholesterol transport system auxiliary component
MRNTVKSTLTQLIAAVASAALLASCATDKPASNATFDFGPASMTQPAPATPPAGAVVVTDVTGSAALDNERMYYRLQYANPLQARTYSNSRWAATPLEMVTQRLKTRIAQSGTKVLTATDASSGVSIMRTEIDDFTHSFETQAQSHGVVALRVSIFQGNRLVDQRTFSRKTPADSADAAGGARALAASTDAVAADIIAWIAALPPRKQ